MGGGSFKSAISAEKEFKRTELDNTVPQPSDAAAMRRLKKENVRLDELLKF